ncbi:MAG: type I pullulanase [Clostridia bacterium]|nr:type I pullulanase [Clostridia bacterium]
MKKRKILAVLSVLLSSLFAFAACGPKGGDEEYTLEKEDGCNQLTIYYNREQGYDDSDVWLWADEGFDGRFLTWHECDYGAKTVVNVPNTVEKVGYIIRTNVTPGGGWDGSVKDGTDTDRSIKITGEDTVIYTKAGDPNNYTSEDGGKTLTLMRFIAMADMVDATHVQITVSDNSTLKLEDVSIKDGDGNAVTVSAINNNKLTTSKLDLGKSYTLYVTGFDEIGIVPMTYFSSKAFEDEYTYTGNDLGVTLDGDTTTFKLWAPTATSVRVNMYRDGSYGDSKTYYTLTRGEKGVWSYTHNENLAGKYYTYTVTTSMGEQEAVDPYARSAGLNGQRGMILDLATTNPDGWTSEDFGAPEGVVNYTDAEIWEVHIRDFSNKIESSQYKGKYLAFTETGLKNANGKSVGIDYLKELGVNYVHLLPSFDYASVDEKTGDGFNWGYDPQNYNVPEGSYSTDPENGATRVNEYKQMVQALHAQGIGVVMDVVYNHTFSADSNLNKIVPYYYYRYNSNGTLSNGSGCGNETASERSMVRKYFVDSVTYWQNEYHLDGFRFDLMGLHDVTTMQAIAKAVHETNPKALIYGEGWTGGTTTSNYTGATLANIKKLNSGDYETNGVAMFNDVLRDGVKGSVWDIGDTGFATGAKAAYLDRVLFGVTGGINTRNQFSKYTDGGWFANNPTNIVNYVSAHDNNTLWDRICHKYGEGADTLALRLKRNALSGAIVQTSLGIPFMQAGEEMLRAKKNEDGTYNENSYNASDAVNNIDWSLLSDSSDQYKMMQYYKGLIAFRKSCPTLRLATAVDEDFKPICKLEKTDGAFVAFTITNPDTNEKLLIIYNAKEEAVNYTLPTDGAWDLYINGETAGATVIAANQTGAQSIAAVSCYVYKLNRQA